MAQARFAGVKGRRAVGRRPGLLLAILAVILTAGLLVPAESRALSCARPSAEEMFDATPYVFRGVPVKMWREERDNRLYATFVVKEYWKGDLEPRVDVQIAEGLLLQPVKLHNDYLVYAGMHKYSGSLYTLGCFRTGLWEDRKDNMAAFEQYRISFAPDSDSNPLSPWVPLGILAISAGTIVLHRYRSP